MNTANGAATHHLDSDLRDEASDHAERVAAALVAAEDTHYVDIAFHCGEVA